MIYTDFSAPAELDHVGRPTERSPIGVVGASSNLKLQFGGRADGSQAFRAGVSTPRFVRIA